MKPWQKNIWALPEKEVDLQLTAKFDYPFGDQDYQFTLVLVIFMYFFSSGV